MDYESAIAYMHSTIQFGIRPGLERIRMLCKKLGNPQDSLKSIHIAGTNGKTSTAKIVSTILLEHGLKVGTYTSPHLVCYTERFEINDRPISPDCFARYLEKIIPFVEEVKRESAEPLTHFEILTALAFYLFTQEKLDCAVLETGMGGRWDATNLVRSRIAILTNVELEHTDRLGKTVREIAWEKAHIIKKGCLAIAGDLNRDALDVTRERCLKEKVELKASGADFALLSRATIEDNAQLLSVRGLFSSYENLLLPLAGKHQTENAVLAIAGAEAFLGGPLSPEKLGLACQAVTSPGRFEVVSTDPLMILDGAHNLAGVLRLLETLDQLRFDQLVLVLAILEDKNVNAILQAIVPHADLTVVTENHSERCIPANELAQKVAALNPHYLVKKPLRKAIEAAVGTVGKDDLILITGSLYTIGDSKECLTV